MPRQGVDIHPSPEHHRAVHKVSELSAAMDVGFRPDLPTLFIAECVLVPPKACDFAHIGFILA